MLKTYSNSGEKQVFKFHEQTGKQLCLLILHGKLHPEELFELFYFFVFIDKNPKQMKPKLEVINQRYHAQSLRTAYTINVDQYRLQNLRSTARLYLD